MASISGFATDFSIAEVYDVSEGGIFGQVISSALAVCVICGYVYLIKRLYTIHVIIVVHVSNPPFVGCMTVCMLFGVILQISVINKWFAYITSLCVWGVFEFFFFFFKYITRRTEGKHYVLGLICWKVEGKFLR